MDDTSIVPALRPPRRCSNPNIRIFLSQLTTLFGLGGIRHLSRNPQAWRKQANLKITADSSVEDHLARRPL